MRHRLLSTLAILYIFGVLLLPALALAGSGQEVKPKPAQEEGGTIKGSVVGPGDRPLANVHVTITGPSGPAGNLLTGDDGGFEVKVPKVGQYQIKLEISGFKPARVSAKVDLPNQVVMPVFRLTPATLRVRVYSGAGNQGLGGVSVVVSPHDGGESLSGSTNADGEAFFGTLRPGNYTIKASLTGYEPSSAEVVIPSTTETTTQNFLLSKGSSVPVARSKQKYGASHLPSEVVQQIFQDATGYIWFATDRGVARFDGANFESTKTLRSDLAALDGKDVRCIAQRGDELWFAAADGLWRLGPNGLTSVPELDGQTVSAVAVGADRALWVATSAGLYRNSEGQYSRVAQGTFTAITRDDRDGSLWVVGGLGPGLFHLVGGQLQESAFAASPALDGNAVTAVHATRTGDLLVGTTDGAYLIVGDSPTPFLQGTVRKTVTSIIEDIRGNIWIGTELGVVLYNTSRQATNIEFSGERINGLTNDREGNLWFATDQGAIRRDLYSFVTIRTSEGLINNNVTSAFADTAANGGAVWLATPGGVQRSVGGAAFELVGGFDPEARVSHLVRDRSGQLWLATTRGVYRGVGAEATQLSKTPSRWVASTPDGQVWVATDASVQVFDGKTFVPVTDLAGYVATRVFAVGDDLWLATDHGAVRYNPQRRTIDAVDVSRGVQGEAVRWVAPDRAGHVWLATDLGVEIVDAQTLKKVDSNAGVNSGTDARTLMLDADGFMWVGSADKVRKIAFYDGGVIDTTFTSDQGIAGSLVNALAQDPSGTIWIATDGGVTQHLPTRTLPAIVPRIEVDGRPVEDGSLVPAGQHTIRFIFHGITLLGDVRYLYRVDSDGPWQQLPARQELEREVPFTDLTSGEHVFELRALNRDLYGIDAPPVQMRLRIDVRVWRKWWFYGIGLLGVAGMATGAGLAYRYKTREYVLPPELRHYVPIEPNPYIVGNPIRGERMFFGREDDFRYVRTKLEGAQQGVVVVLCGERRTGKSSILYQILNGRLGSQFIPVFVDLQEMVVSNDREFFRRVARIIAEAVHIDRAEVDRFGFQNPELNPYHQFVDFLDDVLERIGERSLLVLIDEYELLESKVDEGRLDNEIFLFLAGLMDSKDRLSFIFTGSRRLEDRDKRYWREMLRRSLYRKIGFLSRNDAQRLITEPVATRVVYGRGAVDRIVRLTAGQPFYTQVICQTAVDYLNEHERNALTLGDVDEVVAEIVDHPLPQMIYFWDGLSADEKVVLSLLAHHLDAFGDGAWATAGEISALIMRENIPVDLSENTIHLTLEELFRTEVLEKSPFEAYRFRVDLLRLWIHRSHSIWQVLKGT